MVVATVCASNKGHERAVRVTIAKLEAGDITINQPNNIKQPTIGADKHKAKVDNENLLTDNSIIALHVGFRGGGRTRVLRRRRVPIDD